MAVSDRLPVHFQRAESALVALVWAFHIAVDRMLGYGLKFCDRFTHTHLGEIGGGRSAAESTSP